MLRNLKLKINVITIFCFILCYLLYYAGPNIHDERFRNVSAVVSAIINKNIIVVTKPFFPQKGALDNFCSEADILKQLIVNAAHASVRSGPLVSASRKSALKLYATSSTSRGRYKGMLM